MVTINKYELQIYTIDKTHTIFLADLLSVNGNSTVNASNEAICNIIDHSLSLNITFLKLEIKYDEGNIVKLNIFKDKIIAYAIVVKN